MRSSITQEFDHGCGIACFVVDKINIKIKNPFSFSKLFKSFTFNNPLNLKRLSRFSLKYVLC